MNVIRLTATAATAIALAGCSSNTNLDAEFNSIHLGDSVRTISDKFNKKGATPVTAESFDVAGFGVSRMVVRDAKSEFSLVVVGTPATEPYLVAKARVPHFICN